MFRRKRRFGFRKPVARKRTMWLTTSGSTLEVAGTTTAILLASSTQWGVNTTAGNSERVKILRTQFLLTAVPLATAESRSYNIAVDDVATPPGNPAAAATYSATDAVHLGALFTPGNTAAAGPVPLFNGFPDGIRNIRVNRNCENRDALWLTISPAAAAGNQLTFSYLLRVLVQYG